MKTETNIQLPPPPRRVPDGVLKQLKRTVLFPRLFGAIWFLTGLPMLIVFLVLGDPLIDMALSRGHAEAPGTVTNIRRSGNRNPYRLDFEFATPDGATKKGRSYVEYLHGRQVGNEVTVQYLSNNPSRSRIGGTRYAPIPLWLFLFPLMFIVAGGLIFGWGLIRFRRLRQLYEQGVAATGTVLGAKWNKLMRMNLGPRTPPRFRYELTYRFADDRGRERRATYSTYAERDSFTFQEGDAVTVVFDRRNPERSLVFDMLKGESSTNINR